MHRIDGPGSVDTQPAPRPDGTPGYFSPGDPASGQLSTRVTYEWLNDVQENLIAPLDAARIAAKKGNSKQLLQAIPAAAIPLWDETLYCTPAAIAAPAPRGASLVYGSDGKLYQAIAISGPDTDAGPQNPVSSTGYWNEGLYTLPVAAASILGGIKVGNGLSAAGDGTVSNNNPTPYTLPAASKSSLGGVVVGNYLNAFGNQIYSPFREGAGAGWGYIGFPAQGGGNGLLLYWQDFPSTVPGSFTFINYAFSFTSVVSAVGTPIANAGNTNGAGIGLLPQTNGCYVGNWGPIAASGRFWILGYAA